jgi:hypothetical protein
MSESSGYPQPNRAYPGYESGSSNFYWTCPAPRQDMSDPTLAPQRLSPSRTYPAPVLGSRKWNWIYPAPSLDMSG